MNQANVRMNESRLNQRIDNNVPVQEQNVQSYSPLAHHQFFQHNIVTLPISVVAYVFTDDWPASENKCIVHGLAQRKRPVVDHLTAPNQRKREDPVTTSPRAITIVRSSPSGYSDVTSGNIFAITHYTMHHW